MATGGVELRHGQRQPLLPPTVLVGADDAAVAQDHPPLHEELADPAPDVGSLRGPLLHQAEQTFRVGHRPRQRPVVDELEVRCRHRAHAVPVLGVVAAHPLEMCGQDPRVLGALTLDVPLVEQVDRRDLVLLVEIPAMRTMRPEASSSTAAIQTDRLSASSLMATRSPRAATGRTANGSELADENCTDRAPATSSD